MKKAAPKKRVKAPGSEPAKAIHPDAAAIGKRIAAARDLKKLSNKQLGAILGIEETSAKKLITGEANVQYAKLATLARGLGTTPNHLLGFNEILDDQIVGAIEVAAMAGGMNEEMAQLLAQCVLGGLKAPPIHGLSVVDSTRARTQVVAELSFHQGRES